MKFLINGEIYKLLSNWEIQTRVGNNTSSVFSVQVEEGQRLPNATDVVEFLDDEENCLFFGVVGSYSTPTYSTGEELKIYNLTCLNGNGLLANRIPNISYKQKTITYIVNDLFNNYIAGEGITLGEISNIPTPVLTSYNSNALTLQAVLNELANYVNATWNISNDKVFSFVITEDFEEYEINENNCVFNSVKQSETNINMRTRQIVEGVKNATTPQTEFRTYIATGNRLSGCMTFPIEQQPIIFIGRTSETLIKCDDVAQTGMITEDQKNEYLFYWEQGKREITINSSYSGGRYTLNDGDIVEVIYIGYFNVRVEIDNLEKQTEINELTGTSGVVENYQTLNNYTSIDEMTEFANNLILSYGDNKKTLSLTMTTELIEEISFDKHFLQLNKQWNFNLPKINILDNFVLVGIKIKPNILNKSDSFIYNLEFTNRDYMQTYSQIISDLYKKNASLSVRDDLTIIKSFSFKEQTAMNEKLYYSKNTAMKNYVCVDLDNGQIATPLGTLYPYVC